MCSRFLFFLLFAWACAAQQPAVSDHDMSKMQHAHTHDGFMQGGMHHAVAQGVTLDAKSDQTSHVITLRVGPMNLPANTSHMKMPQPPDLVWAIPMTGWLLAYHPKLVDAAGNSVPGVVLHHVAFWNENRSDFLCPNKEEHIFGAGGELTDWAQIAGFGYRVEKGDQIRVETMIHNPTAASYEKVFLEISIPYLDDATPAPVKNFYPAWMDVASCGNSSYDLKCRSRKLHERNLRSQTNRSPCYLQRWTTRATFSTFPSSLFSRPAATRSLPAISSRSLLRTTIPPANCSATVPWA